MNQERHSSSRECNISKSNKTIAIYTFDLARLTLARSFSDTSYPLASNVSCNVSILVGSLSEPVKKKKKVITLLFGLKDLDSYCFFFLPLFWHPDCVQGASSMEIHSNISW